MQPFCPRSTALNWTGKGLTGTEKLTRSYRNLPMCHTFHHKFHTTTLGLKLGLHVKLVGDIAWPATTSLICHGSEKQSLNKKKQFSSTCTHENIF